MEDHSNLDHLSLRLDDNDELNALTLTTLLNSGVEEALSNLSPAQLIQLEKNVQKLKKQKTPVAPIRKRSEVMESPKVEKKRKYSSEGSGVGQSGGQYMNLPASAPHVEVKDGMELLYFTYSTKGHIQEYCIRIDIDDITLDEIPEDFKNDNCVYPRALVPREAYTGNRYDYETSVNDLSWKLTWLNAETLAGKRGLIQRAVDSYRNRTTESRSRRVLRQQKLHEGILRRRSANDHHEEMGHDQRMSPKTITLQYTSKTGETSRIKLRVDLESVDLSQIDDSFRQSNCLYPQALHLETDYSGSSRLAYEQSSNEIAWKLAWLNPTKLANQPNILPKAVDAYRARFESRDTHYMEHDTARLAESVLGKGSDFSEMVAHTLQQVLGQHDDDLHSQVSLEDHLAVSDHMREEDEDRPRTMSTADLLGGI